MSASVLELVGQVLAPALTLECELAVKTNARVFRAFDHISQQPAVVKVYFDTGIESSEALRFTREIEVAHALAHPRIVPILRSGREGRFVYYVMPLVPGGSLRDLLEREGPLSLARTRQVVRDVAEALQFAHERGVVHRDIKPGNILLDADGRALISDLGIARSIVASQMGTEITSTGVSVGTPAYMSPEQAAADPRIDGRTDQYALACVAFQMLTGAPPFLGAAPQDVLARHLREPPPAVRVVRPDVPLSVETAILRALAKARAERFPDVRALARAFDDDRPAAPAPAYRRLAAMRRTPVAWMLLVGALVASAAFYGASRSHAPRPRNPARVAVLDFDDQTANGALRQISQGLAESLTRQLSDSRSLEVVSRNAVRLLQARHLPLDSIVTALQPGSLVEGSVDESAGQVRVEVRLIDAESKLQVAAARIERPVGELFRLEEDIAKRVAQMLKARIGAEVAVRASGDAAHSDEARDLAFRADQAREDARALEEGSPQRAAQSLASLRTADSLLALATARDSTWSWPRVQRAWVQLDIGRHARGSAQRAAFDVARSLADQVLRADSSNVAALEVRGAASYWRAVRLAVTPYESRQLRNQARADLVAVVERDSARALAWGTLSMVYVAMGSAPEAEHAAQKALALDAFLREGPLILFSLFRSTALVGNFASARTWCERGAADYPLNPWFVDCALTLMAEDGATPTSPRAAAALLARASSLDPVAAAAGAGRDYGNVYRLMSLAVVWARAGRIDSARATAARARLSTLQDSTLATDFLYDDAYLKLVLGQRDSAAAELKLFLSRRPGLRGLVEQHRRWEPIRALLAPAGGRVAPLR